MQDAIRLLNATLPSEGRYCAFSVGERKRTIFFNTREELAEWILRADQLHEFETPYFACCSFKQGATARRTQDVLYEQELRADVDVREGDETHYQSAAEAYAHIQRVIGQMELPAPWIVFSGHGFHLHWPLIEPMSAAEWKPYAIGFTDALVAAGLKIDPQCSSNPVQVLRLPGTIHRGKWKDGWQASDPQEVQLMSAGDPPTQLKSFRIAPKTEHTGNGLAVERPALPPGSLAQQVSGYSKTSARPMFEPGGCLQMQYFAYRAKDLPEPMFAALCGMVSDCVDGEEVVREIAEQDESAHSNIYRMDRLNYRHNTMCGSLEQVNPGFCQHCEHYGKIKSPRMLATMGGVPTEPPAPIDIDFPRLRNFKWDAEVGLVFEYFNSDNKLSLKKVSAFPTWVESVVRSQFNDKHSLTYVQRVDGDERRVELSIEEAMSPSGYQKAAGKGLMMGPGFHEFTQAWREHLRHPTHAYDQMGWTDNDTAFIWGDKKITANKVEMITVSPGLKPFADHCVAAGDPEAWKKIVSSMRHRPHHAFVFLCGFASIFLKFRLNAVEGGLIVHSSSRTPGTGKSTAGAAAVGIWGNPKGMTFSRSDTVNSRPDRYVRHRHLPIAGDEFLATDPEDLIRDITTHMAAKPKSVTKDSHTGESLQRPGDWQLLLMTCANKTVCAVLLKTPEGQALLTRVVDMRFPEETITGEGYIHKLVGENYGIAAVPFVQHLLKMGREEIVRELMARERYLTEALYPDAQLDERYQIPLLAAVWFTTDMLVELGWSGQWDVKAILQTAVDSMIEQREASRLPTALELLQEWIVENHKHIRTPGHYASVVRDPCYARIFDDQKDFIWISTKKLREWIARSSMTWKTFHVELIRARIVYRSRAQRTICWSGSEGVTGPIECVGFAVNRVSVETAGSQDVVVQLRPSQAAPEEECPPPSPGNSPRQP